MAEIEISAMYDKKWNIGKKVGVKGCDERILYRVSHEDIMGDGVFDSIGDSTPGEEHPFTAYYESGDPSKWQQKKDRLDDICNRSLDEHGLDLIERCPENADRLKRWCAEFFSEHLGLNNLTFKVVFFSKLKHAEQWKTEKAVIY